MTDSDRRDPHQRQSTDDGLRAERQKTDAELSARAESIRQVAMNIVAVARDKADAVLTGARELEDQKSTDRSTREIGRERADEDAALARERHGADAAARDEVEQRQRALASLLAFERAYTDLKLETERERADRALHAREGFMAMVSHDLRSLLGGIALSAELLQQVDRGPDPLERVKLYAQRIQRFTARMNRLVADLMDVASIEAGKLSLVRADRDVASLLHDARDAFEPVVQGCEIQFACDSGAGLGVISIDFERILQVLGNLVGNALKFTPRGGAIAIRSERRDGNICFSVTDNGSGIAPDVLERIFERYYQARVVDGSGLGLGLFISRTIVEGHGGAMWVESVEGQGSTFCFTVPGAAPATPAQRRDV